MARYHYGVSLSWGGDICTGELEVEVSFTVAWGAPACGPTYSHGGLPADPDEIDDVRVETINGKPAEEYCRYDYMPGETVRSILEKLEMDHYAEMLEAAAEQEADARADAMEWQHEPDERQEWADFDPEC